MSEQKWIPVSERLPEEDRLVLWFRPDERWPVSSGRFCLPHHVDEGGDLAVPFGEGKYTHWMPLPEPPPAAFAVYDCDGAFVAALETLQECEERYGRDSRNRYIPLYRK